MKAVFLNKAGIRKDLKEWLPEARILEKTDKKGAVEEYKKMISFYPLNEELYNRVMILYRQLKEPQKEIRWIDQAIKSFDQSHKNQKSKKVPSAKIKYLSNAILKATGMMNKKGKPLYQPHPIDRWQKRKDLLQARLMRK